jgi:hypothetical protein
MDDYRDLVIAGLAVLCAGLMLVAGLLFILGSSDGSKPAEIEPPSPQVAASSREIAPAQHRSIAKFR